MFIKYIKKDVNKILLLLIVVLLLIFAWSTAYYETALKNVSMQYDKNLGKLQEAAGNVIFEKNGTLSFQKDKEIFEKRYYDLSTENEALKLERERLQTELDFVKPELEEQKSKFDKLNAQFQQVQDSLIAANEQISSLIARNQELCRRLEEKGGEC